MAPDPCSVLSALAPPAGESLTALWATKKYHQCPAPPPLHAPVTELREGFANLWGVWPSVALVHCTTPTEEFPGACRGNSLTIMGARSQSHLTYKMTRTLHHFNKLCFPGEQPCKTQGKIILRMGQKLLLGLSPLPRVPSLTSDPF